jgi:hypothetical protein
MTYNNKYTKQEQVLILKTERLSRTIILIGIITVTTLAVLSNCFGINLIQK